MLVLRCIPLVALVLAGCVAQPAPLTLSPAATSGPPPLASWLSWEGDMMLGAAMDIPAHFAETSPVGAPLFGVGMTPVRIKGTPTAIVTNVTWTGGPGTQVELMVSSPSTPGWVNYAAPGPNAFTTEATLCLAVPAEGLQEGVWQMMIHTLVGSQIHYNITVLVEGATAEPGTTHEGWPSVQTWAQVNAAGQETTKAGEPCPS